MEGILLVDKPVGITSFDVIRRLRRILNIKKMGHAGTLDPLASGLMIIGVGSGTKELTALVKLDKEYIAEVLIGQKRSTGDMEGDVIAEKEVEEIFSEKKISSTLSTMHGVLNLPVSAYSAIKKDGVPMYKRAREAASRGEVAEGVPERAMRVDGTELISITPIVLDGKQFQLCNIRFSVKSGTYIRSLAEELGSRLNFPATLYNLRRTKVGEYDIKDAKTLADLADEFDSKIS
ncbi:MAG: tRNA pseudouridine(55) synthase TruB [Candidatus Paceibacteria bacterium]